MLSYKTKYFYILLNFLLIIIAFWMKNHTQMFWFMTFDTKF